LAVLGWQGKNKAKARQKQGKFMAVELSKEDRKQAMDSIERYFQEYMEEKIGNIAAIGLLDFILREIGPSIFNKGVAVAQAHMAARVADLDIDIHEETFAYWQTAGKKKSLPSK
jgi:uncharacterized protein (DUF2164 family)